MKVKISTEIDVPDEMLIDGQEFPSAVEYISDIITRYVEIKHRTDTIYWIPIAKTEPVCQHIVNIHEKAAEICKSLKWNYVLV